MHELESEDPSYSLCFAVKYLCHGLPWWLSGKGSACSAGEVGVIPGLRRSPGGGHDNPLQYSGLENAMDRGAWRATVHGVTESGMSEHTHTRLVYIKSEYFCDRTSEQVITREGICSG